MHYAVYLPNFGAYGDARTLVTLARDAEHAGWDGFFIWDHIAGERWPNIMVDPWVALAAIAVETRRIRIGALVTPIPRRRPWKLARETVSVDRLSGGRLIFGAGIGGGVEEFDHLDEETDPKTRGAMLDEGLEVLTGLWSGEPFSYAGDHYHVTDAHFLPTPVQTPRIPVWVAGLWPNREPMRRAARWDGAFPLFLSEPDEGIAQIKDCVDFLRAQREPAGRDGPFEIVYSGHPTPGDDPDQAAEIVARYAELGITWWLEMIAPWIAGKDWKDPEWPVAKMHERIVQGPPRFDS
jgi:alkanesulfonate monooxygenase SsuD/methylene tetrahydromethanopterin reductase-like flavin-dependent oxidoreductase (luciferase family)